MRQRVLAAVLLLTILLVAPLIGANPAAAQETARDRARSASAAEAILQLAVDGNFNAMYDQIHPDAHAVVPRAAAVGSFADIYADAQPGPAQVVGAELVSWTWPVTGQTYDRAAAIAFVQPFIDQNGQEAWLEDTMYLVEDGGGEWRWFFGSSPEFVEQAIQMYGTAQVAEPITEGGTIEQVVNDLDAFYADVVSYTEFTYQSPGVVVVPEGQGAMSACGPAQGQFAGFYCPPDLTIYLDEPFLLQMEPFAAAFVIAHEWAHHVQSGVGFARMNPSERPDEWNEVFSIELELMADCMAGAWAQDANTRGLLQEGDIDQAIQLALELLGDPNGVGELDPQAHGSGEQRAQAITGGYEQGFLACNLTI